VFCELQGNLFFGTTDQLFTHLEKDLRQARFILMDLRRVQSMDYSAAHLFELMQARLAERGGQLLFCGMPSALLAERRFELYMISLGVIGAGGGGVVSDTLDSALEWIEERILEEAGVTSPVDEAPLSVKDFRLFRGLEGETLSALESCMLARSYRQGERIFSQGDQGEEIFFVRRGSVRILLPLEGGKLHHLATISRGNFFGELSFLDRRTRSAHVEAKTAADLYVLSRSRLEEYLRCDATLGVKVFGRLSLVIAERLRQTDEEMQDLFER
jgi:SulP family sulfate permease